MRLAELVADGVFVDGDWVESKDQDPEGDVRLIQLADVGDGVFVDKSARFLTSSKARELKCTFLERGDILVARMPDPLGRACFFPGVDQPCVTVVDVCIVRPGKRADRRWLLHAINSPSFRKQIERHIKGTTRQRISRTNLGTIELNVPDLPEQRRIADILDKADAIRRKRREAIALTEELLRSTFLEMFGSHRRWTESPLEDLCTDIVDCPHSTPTYTQAGGGHACIRTSDLQGGYLDWTTTKYVDAGEFASRISRLRPAPLDVLYSREGERFGIAALVPDDASLCLGQRMMLLRADKSVCLPEFLWAAMNSLPVYQQALAEVGGSTAPHVNVKAIRRFRLPHPPLSMQQRFVSLARSSARVRVSQEAAVAASSAMFSTLAARCFGGEAS